MTLPLEVVDAGRFTTLDDVVEAVLGWSGYGVHWGLDEYDKEYAREGPGGEGGFCYRCKSAGNDVYCCLCESWYHEGCTICEGRCGFRE